MIQGRIVEEIIIILLRCRVWIERVDVRQAFIIQIANRFQVGTLQRVKISSKIRPPIAKTHHSNINWLIHLDYL